MFATLKIDHNIVNKENPIIDLRYINEEQLIIMSS